MIDTSTVIIKDVINRFMYKVTVAACHNMPRLWRVQTSATLPQPRGHVSFLVVLHIKGMMVSFNHFIRNLLLNESLKILKVIQYLTKL